MASIKELKFTQEELSRSDISSLPDKPAQIGITAEQLKSRFDQIGKQMVALGRYNDLIDALTATQGTYTGAQNIGALNGDVQTNVQSVLDAKLNKANVVHEPGNSESAVMSQNAVMQAISQAVSDVSGGGDGGVLMTKAEYDSENSGDGVVNEARLAQNAQKLDGQVADELSVAHAQNADTLGGLTAGELSVGQADNATLLDNRPADAFTLKSEMRFGITKYTSSVSQAIPNGTSFIKIVLPDNVSQSDEGCLRPNATNDAFTVQKNGTYIIYASMYWMAGTATRRCTSILVNGTAYGRTTTTAANSQTTMQNVFAMVELNVGDILSLGVFQQTGGALDTVAGGEVFLAAMRFPGF